MIDGIYTFECLIEEVGGPYFKSDEVSLRAIDLTDKTRPDEFWVVAIDKFKPEDIPNVRPGYIFFFEIIDGKGSFRPRKQEPMTKEQLEQIKIRTKELCDLFSIECD
jgi:hypothetical protein